jgi:hypothetical protein
MGSLFEFGMNNARQKAAAAIGKFEEILTIIITEAITAPNSWHQRYYVNYKCKQRGMNVHVYQGGLRMYNDHYPFDILAEALARASLETNVDLEENAFMLFPTHTGYTLESNGINRISFPYQPPRIELFDTHSPTTYFNQSLNYEKHSEGRCQALLEARTIKRKAELRAEYAEYLELKRNTFGGRVSQFVDEVMNPIAIAAVATHLLSSTGSINRWLTTSAVSLIDSTSLCVAGAGLAGVASKELIEIESEPSDMTAWFNLGVTSVAAVALLLAVTDKNKVKAALNYCDKTIRNTLYGGKPANQNSIARADDSMKVYGKARV